MSSKECAGSGEIDSSQSLYSNRCSLTSLMVYTDGVNDVTVILYDNASEASGDIVAKIPVSGENDYGGRIWPGNGRRCVNGLYAGLDGTGASCIAEYIEK